MSQFTWNEQEQLHAAHLRMLSMLRQHGITDTKILDVLEKVPRHLFVPPQEADRAYDDEPVSIGYGQTISQPYMVAIMTQSLQLSGGERVLEIGTGSGYQTAVLAEFGAEVYTVERVEALLTNASKILTRLGYTGIQYRSGDGSAGWPEAAPFDAILVAAASPYITEPWKQQVRDGGRIVAPVGSRFSQTLMVYTKHGEEFEAAPVCACVFVPLLGEFGWKD